MRIKNIILTTMIFVGMIPCVFSANNKINTAKSKQEKNEVINYKNYENGADIAAWYYSALNNNRMELKKYFDLENSVIWILKSSSANEDFAIEWIEMADPTLEIAKQIFEALGNLINSDSSLSDDKKVKYMNIINYSLNNMTFNGLEIVDSAWITTKKSKTKEKETVAFAVYSMPKDYYDTIISFCFREDSVPEYIIDYLLNTF